MPPYLIACDFDGTIVEHRFPRIGKPLPQAFEVMKELIAAGHRLILNTCREDEPGRPYLTEAVEFCRANGVEFVSVNVNHPDDEFRVNGGRKLYASFYVDDRNIGGFPGWAKVRELILEKGQPLVCSHKRQAEVCAKCSDLCHISVGNKLHDGYVPDDFGIGNDDYIEFVYCLDCGQIFGKFPLPLTKLENNEKYE